MIKEKNKLTRDYLVELKNTNRADKVVSGLLSTIIGELDRLRDKDVKESEIIAVLKKLRDANEITLGSLGLGDIEVEELSKEIYFINTLLPAALSEKELEEIITDLIEANESFGVKEVMDHLKTDYVGRYDGGLAARMVKNIKNGDKH